MSHTRRLSDLLSEHACIAWQKSVFAAMGSTLLPSSCAQQTCRRQEAMFFRATRSHSQKHFSEKACQGRERRGCFRRAASEQPDAETMQKMMSDPQNPRKKEETMQEQMKRYEEAMKDPAVQAQAEQMAQVMQSQEMMQKMAALREDPELKPMFEEIQKGGMPAMMKYMNDSKWLAKIGDKLGDVPMPAGSQGLAPAEAPAAAAVNSPEINNILDAAKHGDLEATEDFIAIGKDVNQKDHEGRTALHYAVAFKHKDVFDELLASAADLSAEDSKGNTPLHYAAGYGRGEFVKDLIDGGAKGFSKNSSGHTPCDLVRMEQRNPINNDYELMKLLELASSP